MYVANYISITAHVICCYISWKLFDWNLVFNYIQMNYETRLIISKLRHINNNN